MLGDLIGTLSNYLYTYILVILLIAAGLYFTIRTRFVQFRMVWESLRVVGERPEQEGGGFLLPGADGVHGVPGGNRQYRGDFHRRVPGRLWRGVLDVAHRHHRRCLCFY